MLKIITYFSVIFFSCTFSMAMEEKSINSQKWEEKHKDLIFEKHPTPSITKNLSHLHELNALLKCTHEKNKLPEIIPLNSLFDELNQELMDVCGKDQKDTRLKLSSLNALVSEKYIHHQSVWNGVSSNIHEKKRYERDIIRETLENGKSENYTLTFKDILNMKSLKNAIEHTHALYYESYFNYACWSSGKNFYGEDMDTSKKQKILEIIEKILKGSQKK